MHNFFQLHKNCELKERMIAVSNLEATDKAQSGIKCSIVNEAHAF